MSPSKDWNGLPDLADLSDGLKKLEFNTIQEKDLTSRESMQHSESLDGDTISA